MATRSRVVIRRLFWDIETKLDPSISPELIDELVAPRKNIRDPEKIAAAVEERRQEILDNAGLDNDLATIAAISFSLSMRDSVHAFIVGVNGTEREALEGFWQSLAITEGLNVGYNILNFDLPFVLKRSFALGVKPAVRPSLAKYRTEPTTDLFQILNNWSYTGGKKLKWMCGRYGIKVQKPGVAGKDVKDLSDKDLEEYAISDTRAVKDLYAKMNGIYFNHAN